MWRNPSVRTLTLVWLFWAIGLLSFQTIVQNRYQPYRPDRATEWTPQETARNSQNNKPYLLDPFMNNQVSWDSEYYLSIATIGYEDPDIQVVNIPDGQRLSKSYAFFPFYPWLMSVVRIPLLGFGLSPIGASALAGVLVSLAGTLAGVIALYDLARTRLSDAGGRRAAFYLLIFPSSFFLAQVYTEGLFIGLAFSSLALMQRKKLLWAGLLAALATWTRSIGVFLVVPLFLFWLQAIPWQSILSSHSLKGLNRSQILGGLAIFFPLGAYLIWQVALGEPFSLVQDNWFGRGVFDLRRFVGGMQFALEQFVMGENSQMRVYYGLEFLSVMLAISACAFTLRSHPIIALFSFLVILIPLTSGAPQSLIRYMLAVPSLYLLLARLGQHESFDRGWVIFSLLLMSMQVSLFTFDMWVA